MVLDVTKLYPYDGSRTQPGDRPAFGSNSSELSGAVGKDLGSVTEGFKYVKDKIDRFERGSRDAQTERIMDCAEGVLFAGGVMPTLRRVNCLPKDLEEGNWERSALMAGVAAASLPGDFREVKAAWGQIGNIVKNGELPVINGQHKFSFLKGTFLEKMLVNRGWLKNLDKTLFETKFGESVMKTFGVVEDVSKQGLNKIGNKTMLAHNFEGGFFKKLIGNVLLRTNVIGLAISTAIEIPAIIKSAMVEGDTADKAHSVTRQVCKSAGMIGLVTGGISLFGAAAFMICPPLGTVASLIGMAAGSALGVMASKELNKHIDNLFA